MELPGNATDQAWSSLLQSYLPCHLIPVSWLKPFSISPAESLSHAWLLSCYFRFLSGWVKSSLFVLTLSFSSLMSSHLPGGLAYLPTRPLASHSVPPTAPFFTTVILPTSSLPSPFLGTMAPEFLAPTQTGWLFSLRLRWGDEPWKPQMPSFFLFPISSTYPIYNSASLVADWHSTLLGSQNKCNSRIRDKSRLPGFFCSQALVRSFSASIWEMSLRAAMLLWVHLPLSWKFLPYRIFFLADFPSWLCLDQASIKGGCYSPNIHCLCHKRSLRNIR